MNTQTIMKIIDSFHQAHGVRPTHILMCTRTYSMLLLAAIQMYEKPMIVFSPVEEACGIKILTCESIPYGTMSAALVD